MSLREHLDQLNSTLLDFCNIDIKIDEEDAALIMLVSLHFHMRTLESLSLVVKIHFMWKKLGMPFTVENCGIAVVALF